MTMQIFTFPLKTEVYQISRDFFTNSLSFFLSSEAVPSYQHQNVPMLGKYSTEMEQTK